MYGVKEIFEVDVEYPPFFGVLLSVSFDTFASDETVHARFRAVNRLQDGIQFLLQYFNVRGGCIYDAGRPVSLCNFERGISVLFFGTVNPKD